LCLWLDDAGFDLVITSEDLTTKSKEAIAGLIESGVDGFLALLTLRADGNLAAGLLAQAATVDDPALIQPFRERFSAAAAAMERNLGKLRDSPEKERLRQAGEALIAFGSSADNIFDARGQELRAAGETRRSLEAKRGCDHRPGPGWRENVASASDASRLRQFGRGSLERGG